MAVRFQLVIDCANPDRLARFWAAALGYEFPKPPDGFDSWDDYCRDVGVPEEDSGSARTASPTPTVTGRASGSRSSRNTRRSRTGSTSTSTPAATATYHSPPAGNGSTPRSGA